ncbi:response regulator [Oscillatoria acuminata]|uniref:CheY-like receiver domain-containing protein n=1 Tax=Oscillatoria acuminata PCC 6304 TaxID=56110 RepID=K9TM55_9CYAN|nr:response regulator [Oscillatoria acuminata]AFY83231.1 CheY-like receiver domain-containing protein [Oscillatoria acuminata PCC 6304]
MNSDKVAEFFNGIISLIEAIIWPAFAVFFVVYFGDSIKKLINTISEFSLKAGPSGVEANVTRQLESAAMLGAASGQKKFSQESSDGGENADANNESRKIIHAIARVSDPKISEELLTKKVLWVDDCLEENAYEQKALEVLGVQCSFSRNTEEAIAQIKASPYHAVISDIDRPPDDRAGYTLLEEIRRSGYYMPYILYDRTILPEHQSEARRLGANGCTTQPTELFETIISALIGDRN